MGKINIELDLDWVEEDETLDSTIKNEMLRQLETRVMNNVTDSLKKTVLEKSEEKIDALLDDMAKTAIADRIESFLSAPRNITDRYGDVVRENVTIEDLLKERIETAMDKKTLDMKGEITTYSPKYSLFEYLSTRAIEPLIASIVEKNIKEAHENIKQLVADKVKTHVADSLTNMILENSSALGLKNSSKTS